MAKAKFYITERYNPQLSKPYYNARGQKTIKEIASLINGSVYGSQSVHGAYTSEEEYNKEIENLKAKGYRVY